MHQQFGRILLFLNILMVFGQFRQRAQVPVVRPNALKQENAPNIEGHSCFNQLHHLNGYCAMVSDCPEAIHNLNRGINMQICSYKGHLPIICCPRSRAQLFVDNLYMGKTFRDFISEPAPLSVSHQKCIEYSQLRLPGTIETVITDDPLVQMVDEVICKEYPFDPFVVGGMPVRFGEFPHMAIIGSYNRNNKTTDWFCGGSLISLRFVLSAAHCTSFNSIKPNIIRLGIVNYKEIDEDRPPADFYIKQAFPHPDYRSPLKNHDIALFLLDQNIVLSTHIFPACLWQKYDFNYSRAIATGWGLTQKEGKPSNHLLKVRLNIIDNTKCNEFPPFRNQINRNQMCAGDEFDEKDVCNGDTGAPLQNRINCFYHIIGVTSYGYGCGSYGVYTRVSEYLDWIEGIVWPNTH